MNKKVKEEIKSIAACHGLKLKFYNGKLTKKSRTNFCKRVNWSLLTLYRQLSEDFIREFQDQIYWYWVAKGQKLSEDFIIEFADRVNWIDISLCQKISENFILKFYDKINIKCILYNDNINNTIKEKIKLIQRTIQT